MRPRHLITAAAIATTLTAVAVPAYAETAASPSPAATPAAASSAQADPAASPSPAASPTPTPTPSSTAAAKKSAGSPLAIGAAGSGNPLSALPIPIPLPSGGADQLTALLDQLQSLGGGPSAIPIPGLDTLTTCVQDELGKSTPDGAAVEGCFSGFFKTLSGMPQATCLDPLLQGLIGSVQSLIVEQKPDKLVAFLTALPDTLQAIPTCLTPSTGASSGGGGATESPTPSEVATTSASEAATSDPTEAVPVVAAPTFTG